MRVLGGQSVLEERELQRVRVHDCMVRQVGVDHAGVGNDDVWDPHESSGLDPGAD